MELYESFGIFRRILEVYEDHIVLPGIHTLSPGRLSLKGHFSNFPTVDVNLSVYHIYINTFNVPTSNPRIAQEYCICAPIEKHLILPGKPKQICKIIHTATSYRISSYLLFGTD